MKSHFLILLLCSNSVICFAQVEPNALKLKNGLANNIDSLKTNILQPSNSEFPLYHRIDSIRDNFNRSADSQTQYQKTISKIGDKTTRLNKTIDSLQRLNLNPEKYTRKLDSLSRLLQNTQKKFTSKLKALKAKTGAELTALNIPPSYQESLQKLTENIEALNLSSGVSKIPSLEIPGYSVPKLDGIANLTPPTEQLPGLEEAGNFKPIEGPTGDMGKITEQVQTYQQDIQNVAQGNLTDVEALPETIEKQASKIDGIEELEKQSGVIDEYKSKLDVVKDPASSKEKVIELANNAAMDHFAGKQEQLQAAIEKIAKYKEKYSSLPDLKDLSRRPPNPMKGKPFIERLIPGLYLQYQRKNYYLIDVNPYFGYRLSGRFSAGAGWNHRIAYDRKNHGWNKRSIIFGPRAYLDFRLGKGFIAHLESESMNTFVPSTLGGNPEAGERDWVWSFMTGLKKEYRIYKNLKGTALIQYNLFNRYYKAPYVDRFNSRIGFEYTLKKKTTKP